MQGFQDWLGECFRSRPWWMNAVMVFCAFMTFVYMPWDFFIKPIAEDQEAWFGFLLRGAAAKLTEPIHWAIYAAGAYGFWRMRPWMWPWAAVYCATVAVGMLLWPIIYVGGFGGLLMGLAGGGVLGLLAHALWTSAELFEAKPLALRERYGSWALVTGASAGIGAEFARALAREGLSVVLVARREQRLRELADELAAGFGVETRVVAADLTRADEIASVAAAVADLDVGILVNNAGVGYAGRFEKQDLARLEQMVALNCTAPMLLTGRILPGMIERNRGAVVVVGSVAGRQPLPLHAVYSATKSFDVLFGEALWVELRDRGVDVLVVQPGPVATEFEAVAGERRPNPTVDEPAAACVALAFEALGRQPSIVTGSWLNWLRANVNRFLPRALTAFVAGDVMAQQTPSDMR